MANNGNLIAKNPKNQNEKAYRYEYTSVNQLKSVKTLSNPFGSVVHQVNYAYDVLGRRMKKEVIDTIAPQNSGYTIFQYDNERIVVESKYLTQSGISGVSAIYTNSLKIDDVLAVAIPTSGVATKKAKISGRYYFLKDHLGSVQSIADVNGAIKQSYKYSSFGQILSIVDGNNADITNDQFIDNQFTFTGREYECEYDTYYYRARYYDAAIGRFLQQDPHPGHLQVPTTVVNKYIYAVNNPISISDPFGNDIFDDIGRFFVSALITVMLPVILGVALVVGLFDPALGLSIAMVGFQFSIYGQALNKLMTGKFASMEEYEGMPVVANSMFGGPGGFTPGPVSFITPGGTENELLMRHEFGHHLQYKMYGGWAMAGYLAQGQVLQGGGFLECTAGQLARDYFNPNAQKNPYAIGYVPPYHGGYSQACYAEGYY